MAFTARLKGVGEEASKPLLAFYLKIDEDGDVVLRCEEEGGDCWNLLYVEAETGKVRLAPCVPHNIGLAVKSNSTLQVQE